MNRRDVLRYTALATGAALSAPLLSSLLTGCKSELTDPGADSRLKFFSQDDFALVKDLVDLILPKTDSPSASEVGVHQVIDTMVGTVYQEKDKVKYKKSFAALAAYLQKAAGNVGFTQLEAAKKLPLLALTDAPEEVKKAFLDLKQQTVAYYLTTEEIGKNYLNYLPIPGAYDACIQLEEVGGKAWVYEL